MTPTILVQALVSGLLMGFVFALIAMGLSLLYGMLGLVNFAHGDFLMVAMYVSFWLFTLWGLDPLFSIPVAGLLLFCFGIFIHKTMIRRLLNQISLARAFATFGLSVFLSSLMQFFFSADYRMIRGSMMSETLKVGNVFIPMAQITAAVVSFLACVSIWWLMNRTETGKAMRATAENRDAASLVGIDSEKMYCLAWGVSAGSVGIAGAVLADIFYIYPTVGTVFSFTAMVTVALGGFGSIPGAFVGGLIIGVVQTFTGLFFDPVYKMVVVFSMYFLVLIFRPRGLFGKF